MPSLQPNDKPEKAVFWWSYLFFACKILVEVIFVALIAAGAILMIATFWVRIAVASLSAARSIYFLNGFF